MKNKTIKKICRGKIHSWANSIVHSSSISSANEKDLLVRETILEEAIITGGAIVSMLQNEEINDFDVYMRTRKGAAIVAQYYVDKFSTQNKDWMNSYVGAITVSVESDRVKLFIKSAGVAGADGDDDEEEIETEEQGVAVPYQYFESTQEDEAEEFLQDLSSRSKKSDNKNYEPLFLTDNAITLSNQLQLIIRFSGEPEEIHENYDFVHCTSMYTIWNDKLTIPYEALRSIMDKELRYTGSLYPLCSIIRLRKFIKRGWTINAGQILKMCYQVSKLDLDDIAVLKDQLVGVDAAYFFELISVLQNLKEEGKGIDQTYLANMIDKIFDGEEEPKDHE